MTVREAFEIINQLRFELEMYRTLIGQDPYHSDFDLARRKMKEIKKEIFRLEELIYNQELEDQVDE